MGDMDEVIAELQREKEKNAELLERISALEAQLQDETKRGYFAPLMNNNIGQVTCHNSVEEISNKKDKRQRIESTTDKKLGSMVNCRILTDSKVENGLVSWMNMNETNSLLLDTHKDCEPTSNFEDKDDSDDEDEENYANLRESYTLNSLERTQDDQIEKDFPTDCEGAKKNASFGNLSLQKKPPKVAFCPKEIRGILESQELALKNAQSHTMRKIIVFASLGIKHGCEDMYELDYNHFTILRKGDPYISPNDPGEHVLYENPGVKRKVFYVNHCNPALCPVQILKEENAMRPSDATCPSCLFLCIKYGGATRNIPQYEYVRQRMGRNKLKSFGPLICQMARLVNIRTGSFFFKALGITLLFMAGFPDDIVQKETKYRNLDLLQKYYRTDEDVEGEELFHTSPSPSNLETSPLQKPNSKTRTKSKGKKKTNSTSKKNSQRLPQENPINSPTTSTQFGLVGYKSTQNPPSNSTIIDSRPNISFDHHHHRLYPMFPTHPRANAMMPFMYWPSPHNVLYPTFSNYPPSYGYRSLSGMDGGHYISFHPHPCTSVLVPKSVEGPEKNECHLDEATISNSESSSSNEKPN